MRKGSMFFAMFFMVSLVASAAIINFETDPSGAKPNGWASIADPNVTFTDTVGANLLVSNFGTQGNGQSLGVFDDFDLSKLQIDFAIPIISFQLAFGNDDPGWTVPTDLAWLELYDGATLVAQLSMSMNRNDIMDQVIAWSGSPATRAVFWYGNAQGVPLTGNGAGLIEIVDDIAYEVVPEPGTSALLGLGLAALTLVRRRK